MSLPENCWFPSHSSTVNPPISVGSLNWPTPHPPDPPDPPSSLTLPSSSSPSPPLPCSPTVPHDHSLGFEVLPPSSSSSQLAPLSAAQLLASFQLKPPSSPLQIPRSQSTTVPIVASSLSIPYPSFHHTTSSAGGLLGSSPLYSTTPPITLISETNPPPGIPHSSIPSSSSYLPANQTSSGPTPTWADKARFSASKTLKRMAPPPVIASGIPRIEIPDEVFERGAELHKEFIIGRFFAKIPSFKTAQNVLNFMWGKGTKLEIHLNPLDRSMLVRIPNSYIREKVIKKKIWYIDNAMFHVAQWSDKEATSKVSLENVPIWAHLKGVPFDLMTNEGLSWIAGGLGEPKEMDDWTKSLTSLTVAHVKVEADATKPFPTMLELVRKSGAMFNVEVEYPWLPPTCAHCKELGHVTKDCLKVTRKWVPVQNHTHPETVPPAQSKTVFEPSPSSAPPPPPPSPPPPPPPPPPL